MGTVLVVDDDILIRTMSNNILSGKGYDVFTAASASQGLEVLRKEAVDVVLLDIIMPEESGFEMLPKINKIDPPPAVIIMTAAVSLETAIKAIRLGAYDYISKSVLKEALFHSVGKALEHHRLLNENKNLLEELSGRVDGLELFRKVATALPSNLVMQELLEEIMKVTKDVFRAETCSVLLLDEKSGDLVFSVALGEKGDEVKKFSIKPGQGIAGWIAEKGEPLLIENAKEDHRFFQGVDKKTGFETKSILAAPLFLKNKILGIIEIINKVDGGQFTKDEMDTLVTMSGQIAIAIDNAQMTEALKKSREQIEKYSNNLKLMVKERTMELEQANRELKGALDETNKANEELKETRAQMIQSEKMASVGQLAAGVAHEINNPLSFVASNINTLSQYSKDIVVLIRMLFEMDKMFTDNKYKEALVVHNKISEYIESKNLEFTLKDIEQLIEESNDGVGRIKSIVMGLKEFSHKGGGKLTTCNFNECVENTIKIAWNEIKYKAVLQKELGGIPMVECRPQQIKQVLLNIILNAVQAMPGGDKGKIEVRTYANDTNVFVDVSDNGLGIQKEVLDKIFDPFFTTKPVGIGTGLGLSIAYGIIKDHDGEILVDSRPGDGTKFTISLPIKAAKKTHTL